MPDTVFPNHGYSESRRIIRVYGPLNGNEILAKAPTEWDLKIWVYRFFYRPIQAGFSVLPSPRQTATLNPVLGVLGQELLGF
jgi:hypothetical protein